MNVSTLLATSIALAALVVLSACSTTAVPASDIVQGPLAASPIQRPANIERINSGSIYQAGSDKVFLGLTERRPSRVGDTVKVTIAETLNATNSINSNSNRETKLAAKGPGSKSGLGLISTIMNLDASASGSGSFTGAGKTENSSAFNGQIAATVINVLGNGNLVVAGERTIALNGNVNVLRFSGIVNPHDITSGNVVASADTVNARFELVGRGDVSDGSSRTWMQRVLADSLAFW